MKPPAGLTAACAERRRRRTASGPRPDARPPTPSAPVAASRTASGARRIRGQRRRRPSAAGVRVPPEPAPASRGDPVGSTRGVGGGPRATRRARARRGAPLHRGVSGAGARLWLGARAARRAARLGVARRRPYSAAASRVEQIRVVGARSGSTPAAVAGGAVRISSARRCRSSTTSAVKAALVAFPLIESYTLEARPPHELVVRIVERTPIGVIQTRRRATRSSMRRASRSSTTDGPARGAAAARRRAAASARRALRGGRPRCMRSLPADDARAGRPRSRRPRRTT